MILRRRAFDPPAGVRTDLDVLSALAARFGKRQPLLISPAAARCSTSSAAPPPAGRPTTPASPTSASRRKTACSGRARPPTIRARRACSPIAFRRPAGARGFTRCRTSRRPKNATRSIPLFLTTGRVLAHYQSGTQTRRVDELQQAVPEPLAEMHPATAKLHGLSNGGRVTLTTRRGAATFTLKVTPTIREDTVFVPFHWGGEQSANRLTNAGARSDEPDAGVQGVRGRGPPAAPGSPEASEREAAAGRRRQRHGGRAPGRGCARPRRRRDLFDVTVFGERKPHGNYNRILLSRRAGRQPQTRRTSSSTRCRGTRPTASTLHAGVRVKAIDTAQKEVTRRRRHRRAVRHARHRHRQPAAGSRRWTG